MWVRWARESEDSHRTPVGINIGLGSVLVVTAAIVAALLSDPMARYSVLVVAVAGFAAGTVDELALAWVVGIGFLVFDGFLVNRLGELTWHGMTDMLRLGALIVAASLGLATGEAYRLVRRVRRPRPWVNRPAHLGGSEPARTTFIDEEKHGA